MKVELFEKKVVVVDGLRTAFCKERTLFGEVEPEILGALAVKEMIRRMKKWNLDPSVIDHVVGANVVSPVHAANVARVIAVKAGLPINIPAETLNKNCGSGLFAADYGRMLIETGRADTVLVLGVESMTKAPFVYQESTKAAYMKMATAKDPMSKIKAMLNLYPKLFQFWKKENQPLIGIMLGLTDPICDLIMGLTAENLVRDPCFGITRHELDTFSMWSHRKAATAQSKGLLREEIAPVSVPTRKGYAYVDSDNGIRMNQSMQDLAKLKPLFDRRYGSVTAGNSSQVTDGAACLLLMNEKKAKSLSLPILGYLKEYDDVGFEPSIMGLSPVGAIAKVLKKSKLSLSDFSVVEINEAFAAVPLACLRTMASDTLMKKWYGSYGFDKALGEVSGEQFNPRGGAVALGHPVGVTGLRLILTALKELQHRDAEKALLGICIGGGQGVAMVVERR